MTRMKQIAGAVVGVLVGAGITWFATGDSPDPADITCEAAEEILKSEACADETPEEPEAPAEATPEEEDEGSD